MMQQEIVSQPSASAICDISHSNSDLLCFVYHGTTFVTMQWFSDFSSSFWFSVITIGSCLLAVVLNGYHAMVLNDSQQFSEWFTLVLSCHQYFSVFLNHFQWLSVDFSFYKWLLFVTSGVVLNGYNVVVHIGYQWFSMAYHDSELSSVYLCCF